MKKQNLFPSMVLIGFGLYFFLQQAGVQFGFPVFTWPTVLLIVGIALLIQAYSSKDFEMIVPAILFLGLGVHFHVIQNTNIQLDHIGVIILFISLGYFLVYQKTKKGLFYFWLFLVLALIQLFYDKFIQWIGVIEGKELNFTSLWPIVLVIVGVYLFFFKKK